MPENEIPKRMFIDAFSETMGVAKAQSLFDDALKTANLPIMDNYSLADAETILKQYQAKGGLIKIVAMNIYSRLLLRGIREIGKTMV